MHWYWWPRASVEPWSKMIFWSISLNISIGYLQKRKGKCVENWMGLPKFEDWDLLRSFLIHTQIKTSCADLRRIPVAVVRLCCRTNLHKKCIREWCTLKKRTTQRCHKSMAKFVKYQKDGRRRTERTLGNRKLRVNLSQFCEVDVSLKLGFKYFQDCRK